MDINFAEPYYNEISINDEVYDLYWCNRAFIRAQEFMLKTYEEMASFSELLELSGKAISALLYGASQLSYKDYLLIMSNVSDKETISTIVTVVADGVLNYMPDAFSEPQPEGDEEWPEAVKEETSKEIDFANIYLTLSRMGITYDMFLRLTLRNILTYMRISAGQQERSADWITAGGVSYGTL